MRPHPGTPLLAVALAALSLSACAVVADAAPPINRETDWVQDYPALGEPVSAAASVRDTGDSRIPAPDDAYDAVVRVTPETMATLTESYPDLEGAELDSFTPEWVHEELSGNGPWWHSDELDAVLEDQDDAALIINAFLDPEHQVVVLVLMEL